MKVLSSIRINKVLILYYKNSDKNKNKDKYNQNH
jgi:hypothetical protein